MSDKLSDVRHDYVRCIGRTHRDFYGQSWCGRNIRPEFHFLDLDHAVENNRQGGRLVPCPACVAAATAYLASPAPAIPACKWQPIETAPKDGKVVLLWLRSPWSEPRIAWWYESWRNWQPQGAYPHPTEDDMSGIGSQVPTHWMPLPADPTTDSLKAAPAISESEDAARWIATSDRLPSSAEEVLVAVEFFEPGDWRIKVGYLGEQGDWHVFGGSWTPTHWMPLPASPVDAARKGEKS